MTNKNILTQIRDILREQKNEEFSERLQKEGARYSDEEVAPKRRSLLKEGPGNTGLGKIEKILRQEIRKDIEDEYKMSEEDRLPLDLIFDGWKESLNEMLERIAREMELDYPNFDE